jgi:predicted nucleotidyltransferase
MRKLRPNDALFPKIRQRVLGTLFMHSAEWRYLSDLAQELAVSPSSLQREIHNLIAAEILEAETRGNRLYFRPNKDGTLFPELSRIVLKTSGLADIVLESLRSFSKKIDVAFIYGSIARGEWRDDSDVDIMIIGAIQLLELALPIRRLEKMLKRSINPVLLNQAEAKKMLRSSNHFLDTVLAAPKLMLIKNDRELVRLIESRQAESAQD